MRLTRSVVVFWLFVLSIAFSSFAFSSSAFAASWLDGKLEHLMTNEAVVTCGGESVDFSSRIISTLKPDTTEISGVPVAYSSPNITRADLYDLALQKLDLLSGYAVGYTRPEFYPDSGRAIYFFQDSTNSPLSFVDHTSYWVLTDARPSSTSVQITCRPDLGPSGSFFVEAYSGAGEFVPLSDSIPSASVFDQIVFIAQTINYPDGYDGSEVPDSLPPPLVETRVTPEFSYNIGSSGQLRVQYLKNISPFLTGTSYLKIDKMTSDWESVDENLDIITVQPAGWLDESYQLPGPGYYQFDVSHNQQLDQPPWPAGSTPHVDQVWVQFYWDGKSVVTGSTTGCGATEICNDMRKDVDLGQSWFNSLQINQHGLQSFIFAPFAFFSKLTSSACEPLPLPLPHLGVIQLPCMTTAVYRPYFGFWLLLYQSILTGIVVYFVATNAFARVKSTVRPNDDDIEVAQL